MHPRHHARLTPKRKKYPKDATPEQRSCTLKVKYPTEQVARVAAQVGVIKSHGRTERMWVYRCAFCDGWHVSGRFSKYGGAVTAYDLGATASPPAHPAQKVREETRDLFKGITSDD